MGRWSSSLFLTSPGTVEDKAEARSLVKAQLLSWTGSAWEKGTHRSLQQTERGISH